MKFRLVWMDSDNDRDNRSSLAPRDLSRPKSQTLYEQRDGAIFRRDHPENGRLNFTPLTNFTARIVNEILFDDGEQERRELRIAAELKGRTLAFTLSPAEFSRMGWVLSRLGPEAIVYPGRQQHARVAIQWLSGEVPQERIFTHLGWRKHGDAWLYLHAGGALGANGICPGLQVQLDSGLMRYELARLGDPSERLKSIRASLRCLALAPDRITFPLFAAVCRAPFGTVDFSLFVTGGTGVFKTALVAIAQQHFGHGMDPAHLPANFSSTANALESLAFQAKDALLVVDDFVPTGRHGDDGLEAIAERLFRGAGNHQGRSRMKGNGRAQRSQPPRALLVATGEEVPRGHSIRARLLIVEVAPGDVDLAALTECQRSGEEAQLATAMSAFLGWIAGRYEVLQERLKTRSEEIRGQGRGREVHARLPGALAQLQSGFEIWLQFALEAGAIDVTEQRELQGRSERALHEVADRQARYHQASDPALRFIGLLRAALASGQAHVANRRGAVPEMPGAWGWRRDNEHKQWVPQGARIGWIKGSDLFLDPEASYQIAQALARPDELALSQQTLHHRLREGGLLASVDPGRQMVQVRRTFERCPRQVLHLKAKNLTGES